MNHDKHIHVIKSLLPYLVSPRGQFFQVVSCVNVLWSSYSMKTSNPRRKKRVFVSNSSSVRSIANDAIFV